MYQTEIVLSYHKIQIFSGRADGQTDMHTDIKANMFMVISKNKIKMNKIVQTCILKYEQKPF